MGSRWRVGSGFERHLRDSGLRAFACEGATFTAHLWPLAPCPGLGMDWRVQPDCADVAPALRLSRCRLSALFLELRRTQDPSRVQVQSASFPRHAVACKHDSQRTL